MKIGVSLQMLPWLQLDMSGCSRSSSSTPVFKCVLQHQGPKTSNLFNIWSRAHIGNQDSPIIWLIITNDGKAEVSVLSVSAENSPKCHM